MEKQEKLVQNYKGNRKVDFQEGQKVYIRDYRNPNKSSKRKTWSSILLLHCITK